MAADLSIGMNGAIAPIESPQPGVQPEGAAGMVGKSRSASGAEVTPWVKDVSYAVQQAGALGLLAWCLIIGSPLQHKAETAQASSDVKVLAEEIKGGFGELLKEMKGHGAELKNQNAMLQKQLEMTVEIRGNLK